MREISDVNILTQIFPRLRCIRQTGALCGWLLLLVVGSPVLAHGPYDHSAQLVVGETQLELVVTMGADATHDFLAGAGLPENVMQALSPSPPQAPYALPLEIAPKLFIVTADGKLLTAKSASVRTAGLECLFTLIFPRPDGGSLDLRAVYFNGIEPMKRGLFVAEGEDMTNAVAAPLSRLSDLVQLALPTRRGSEAAEKPAVVIAQAKPEAVSSPATTPAGDSPKPGMRFGLVMFGVVVVLLLFAWRRRASP